MRLTLFWKFCAGIALVLLTTASFVWIGTSTIRLANNLITRVATLQIRDIDEVNHLLTQANKVRRLETDLAHFSDIFAVHGACDELLESAGEVRRHLEAFAGNLPTEQRADALRLGDDWGAYVKQLAGVVAHAREMRMDEVVRISAFETWPVFAGLESRLEELSTQTREAAHRGRDDAWARLAVMRNVFFATAVVGVLLCVSGALLLWRSLGKRVLQLRRAAQLVSEGRDDTAQALGANDEITDLGELFQEMAERVCQREAQLRAAHDEMGERVELRTRELAETNERLVSEARERAQAERSLREAEERYRKLFEAAVDGVVVLTEALELADWNAAAEVLFGFSSSPQCAYRLADLLSPEVRLAADDIRCNALGGSGFWQGEARALHCSGRSFDAELSATRFTSSTGCFLLLAVRDVTQKKQAEAERQELRDRLARSEKMEALGVLAGGVAHDLNNVLSPLVAYPDLLRGEFPPGSETEKAVERIQAAALRAAAIVQDLLTLARRGVSVREKLDLNDVVAHYRASSDAAPQGVEVVVRCAEGPLDLVGSSVQLFKVLLNLAQNAVEASVSGQRVVVSTRRATLESPLAGYELIPEGDYVVLEVKDEGTGIAPQHLPHIFEPFYSRKTLGRSGTGLGMAVVWGAVRDHRGSIDVKTAEGRGTTVTLYFPTSAEPATSSSGDREIPAHGRGETILVVDDLEAQRTLATKFLSLLNYVPVAVESGEAAVAWLREHRADLLVLDMILGPGLDGLDTYREALALHPGQRAILCSGFAESERVTLARALGASSYLMKPYTLVEFARAVRRELDRPPAAV